MAVVEDGVAAGVGEFVLEWDEEGVVARLTKVAVAALVPLVPLVLFLRPHVGLQKARLADAKQEFNSFGREVYLFSCRSFDVSR